MRSFENTSKDQCILDIDIIPQYPPEHVITIRIYIYIKIVYKSINSSKSKTPHCHDSVTAYLYSMYIYIYVLCYICVYIYICILCIHILYNMYIRCIPSTLQGPFGVKTPAMSAAEELAQRDAEDTIEQVG